MNIEMYYLSYCPYSKKALDLLQEKKVDFTSHECDKDKEELKRKNFHSTFPQIFIENKLIGGYTELVELDNQGFFNTLDTDLVIDKRELGKITESMRHFLLAKNYVNSKKIEQAKEHLVKSLELFDNLHAKQLLETL